MIKFLQVNLNRSWPALQLMYATAAELDIDILIVNEPPRVPSNSTGWFFSQDGSCAVAVRSAEQVLYRVCSAISKVCPQYMHPGSSVLFLL